MHQKELRGLNTAWIEAGPGGDSPILLLLHGYPDAADSWSYQIDHFQETYTVVAPYGRGAAPSEKPKDRRRYAPDAAALDVLAILDEVDPGRERPVVVVGHDLGVVHAWHVAGLLQKRAKALIVINGMTIRQMLRRWHRPRQLLKSWYIFLMQVPLLPELLLTATPRPLLAFAHAKGGLEPDRRPALQTVRGALTGPLNQYRAFVREIPALLARPERRLTCPLLVLWGSEDAFLMPPSYDELEADSTDVTIRILPGNHWLQRQQPDKVNALITDFCRKKGGLP